MTFALAMSLAIISLTPNPHFDIDSGWVNISEEKLECSKPHYPVSRREKPFVDDAIKRWKGKSYPSYRAMEGMAPIVMHFPREVCVQLIIVDPAIGGEPIYCYEPLKLDAHFDYDTIDVKLTRKFDDVE